ncbi:methyltransferase domain-containing protein [Microbispora siamensis]
MSVSTARTDAAGLVAEFVAAPPAAVGERYRRLVGGLWQEGMATGRSLPAVPELVAGMGRADPGRQGYLAILLGLLAESEYPAGGPLSSAVRRGMQFYLELLAGCAKREPRTLALLYLLSHFPEDRDQIMAAVVPLDLDADDLSRLDRSLRRLDPDDPDLGRVWPSPSVWKLTEEERRYDRERIAALAPQQTATNWENDTRTVFGYSGAKAYWAVRHGMPAPLPPQPSSYDPPPAPELGLEAFSRHGHLLRCPACRGGLALRAGHARCKACSLTYPIARGILDLSAGVRDTTFGAETASDAATADLLQKLSEMPSMGLYYEAVLRPAFLRMAGANWGEAVTPQDEDAYIVRHLSGTEGPVLDLAAGAGRWTTVVAGAVGADRLIALDMGLPMLTVLRGRLPEVPAVRASALRLPFEDASLGAVNCWNALQAFPDDAATAIAEVGRVLRPGGVLTMMTFLFDPDPVARHFQASHFFPSRPQGMLLFEREHILGWLAGANLKVRDMTGPGTFILLTAEREG